MVWHTMVLYGMQVALCRVGGSWWYGRLLLRRRRGLCSSLRLHPPLPSPARKRVGVKCFKKYSSTSGAPTLSIVVHNFQHFQSSPCSGKEQTPSIIISSRMRLRMDMVGWTIWRAGQCTQPPFCKAFLARGGQWTLA